MERGTIIYHRRPFLLANADRISNRIANRNIITDTFQFANTYHIANTDYLANADTLWRLYFSRPIR